MKDILDPFQQFVSHYIDDILIFSTSAEKDKKHLQIVISNLSTAGMKLNLSKCEFFQDRVTYLGYVLDRTRISIDSAKLLHIKDLLPPRNVKKVGAFLGLINYYSKIIQNFASLYKNFYNLLKKGNKFIRSKELEEDFVRIKQPFVDALTLIHLN